MLEESTGPLQLPSHWPSEMTVSEDTILIGNLQLQQQFRILAIWPVLSRAKWKPPRIPACAEQDFDGIFAAAKLTGHIVGQSVQPLVIRSETIGEMIVTDTSPVER